MKIQSLDKAKQRGFFMPYPFYIFMFSFDFKRYGIATSKISSFAIVYIFIQSFIF